MSSAEMSPDSAEPTASPEVGGGRKHTPVFLNSRKEAIVIFGAWFVAMCWSVPYCYINGYGHEVNPETFSTTMGIPSWLFGGILLPWIAADLFTTWVCFGFMKDDELGLAGDEEVHDMPVSADATEGGQA
tara:strand:+ start:543 stop:932 length:390 start_codon:yes stop_codon:yes gene_type:complete